MDSSDKEFQWFMKEAKKDGIKLDTEEEYRQMQRDLYALANLTYDMYQVHKQFEARLECEPGGFQFPAEGRTCTLCMGGGAGDFWYDKMGMRCMDCQTAYLNKVVPGYVFTDKDNKRHITETRLIVRFNAERKDIRRYIKEGVLKARRIEHDKSSPTLIFLKRENPQLAIWSK